GMTAPAAGAEGARSVGGRTSVSPVFTGVGPPAVPVRRFVSSRCARARTGGEAPARPGRPVLISSLVTAGGTADRERPRRLLPSTGGTVAPLRPNRSSVPGSPSGAVAPLAGTPPARRPVAGGTPSAGVPRPIPRIPRGAAAGGTDPSGGPVAE